MGWLRCFWSPSGRELYGSWGKLKAVPVLKFGSESTWGIEVGMRSDKSDVSFRLLLKSRAAERLGSMKFGVGMDGWMGWKVGGNRPWSLSCALKYSAAAASATNKEQNSRPRKFHSVTIKGVFIEAQTNFVRLKTKASWKSLSLRVESLPWDKWVNMRHQYYSNNRRF